MMRERERKSEEAARLAHEATAFRAELAQLERRRDTLRTLGFEHLTHTIVASSQGSENFAFGPVRSKKNGEQLARDLEPRFQQIAAEIARRERAIKEPLS